MVRTTREMGQTLRGHRKKFNQVLGREPHLSDLADASGMTEAEIVAVELAIAEPESLHK